MAASSAMQSILSSPLTRVTNRSSVNQFLVPTCFVQHLSRNATMPVRCMAGQVMKSNRATCIFFFFCSFFLWKAQRLKA